MNVPCLYFSVSDDGRLADMNELFCQRLQYTRDELLGQKQELIFTLATRIFQQTHFFPLLKLNGEAEEIFLTLRTKEGSDLPVLVNAVRRPAGESFVTDYAGMVVHNRKKFEDELLAARRAAETAERENTSLQQARQSLQQHAEMLDEQMYLVKKQNEELLQFNHVVTHELQEPLRKLFLFTGLLAESQGPATNAKAVSKIMSVAEQMRTLLSGLQQYVWLTETAVKPTPLQLHHLLAAAVEGAREKGAELALALEPVPTLYVDAAQQQFLWQELVTNAVRFASPDRSLTLQLRCTPVQVNRFKTLPDKYQYTGYLKLELSDNGLGFDAGYREQVFSLFKRLHASSGRGVGLALCKKVVENHHGTIAIDSSPGVGTTVTIFLPTTEMPASPGVAGVGNIEMTK